MIYNISPSIDKIKEIKIGDIYASVAEIGK